MFQAISDNPHDPHTRHGNKETALFLYSGVELVSPTIINAISKGKIRLLI